MEQTDNPLASTDNTAMNNVLDNDNRIARLGDRLLALIIDGFVVIAMFILTGMIIASQFGSFTETGFSLEGTPAILTFTFTTLLAFLYFWILEGLFGATLGKVMTGIKVVEKRGIKCNLKSSFIRNLLRLIDGIALYLVGFLIAIFSKLRQRLGDHLANTIVVEVRPKGFIRTLAGLIWVLIIGVSLFFSFKIYSQYYQSTLQSESENQNVSVLAEGDLKIVNFSFLDSKDGNPLSERSFNTGEKIFSKYDIVGYTINEQGFYELEVSISVFDPEDKLVLQPWSTKVKEQPEKSNSPVKGTFNFELPDYCPTGDYKIKFSAFDAVKNKTVELVEKFFLKAEKVPVADKPEIRDFYFSLSEDGEPLEFAVISPGKTIYSNCKIAGMKFDNDYINVAVDLKVFDPNNKLLIDKPSLITINDEFIYHPSTFYQIISAWVSLPSDALKGTYKWKYTLQDKFANISTDYLTKFEVR